MLKLLKLSKLSPLRLAWPCLTLALLWAPASALEVRNPVKPLPHAAYIWHRAWSPPLLEAIAQSAPLLDHYRLLALHSPACVRTCHLAPLQRMQFDVQALRASGKPLWLVVRLDAALPPNASARSNTIAQMMALVQEVRQQGLPVHGLEIDHDAALRQLPAYTLFLKEVATALAQITDASRPPLQLSITALPAWLESRDLENLLSSVQQVVFQLHGVDGFVSRSRKLKQSRQDLKFFDAQQAQAWHRAFAARSPVPYWLALPNYGYRLELEPGSRPNLHRVQGEGKSEPASGQSVEVESEAAQLALFLQQLPKASGGRAAQGIIWFRQPGLQDKRIWSLASWHSFLRGQYAQPGFTLVAQRTQRAQGGGEYRLQLKNTGAVDAKLPPQIRLYAECMPTVGPSSQVNAGSGAAYQAHSLTVGGQSQLRWLRQHAGVLRVGAVLELGTLQCKETEQALAEKLEVVQILP